MTTTTISMITAVFTDIGSWIVSQIQSLTRLFYTDGGLTFLGVLSVCGLAFSLIFLLLRIIQNFLHFRG